MIPFPNIALEVEGGYLVIARTGRKWVIAPFETYEAAESHVAFLEQKWTSTQIHILRNA